MDVAKMRTLRRESGQSGVRRWGKTGFDEQSDESNDAARVHGVGEVDLVLREEEDRVQRSAEDRESSSDLRAGRMSSVWTLQRKGGREGGSETHPVEEVQLLEPFPDHRPDTVVLRRQDEEDLRAIKVKSVSNSR